MWKRASTPQWYIPQVLEMLDTKSGLMLSSLLNLCPNFRRVIWRSPIWKGLAIESFDIFDALAELGTSPILTKLHIMCPPLNRFALEPPQEHMEKPPEPPALKRCVYGKVGLLKGRTLPCLLGFAFFHNFKSYNPSMF